jgi:lysophospholipase L1-like esterase
LAGTNNLNPQAAGDAAAESISRGIHAILDACRAKAPHATIIITAIFPRDDKPGLMPTIQRINEKIAKFAVGDHVRFLNVNGSMTGADGKLLNGIMRDGLHPTIEGYQIWADGLRPILIELLGPPAPSDHAPPPTGDPSVASSSK